MKEAVSITVFGKVQGVSYRKSTHTKALEIGLTGWVKNLPDGSVEIHAEGETSKLLELYEWCKVGPSLADVTDVDSNPVESQNFETFEIIF